MFATLLGFVGQTQLFTDSDSNLIYAENWYLRGVFSVDTEPPYEPTAINTPGYPLFLILTGLTTGWIGWTIILQILLVTVATVLLYRFLKEIFDVRVAWYAALLFALEPWVAFVTSFPLTEATFLFVLVCGWYAFERALRRGDMALFGISGACIGASAMIRPISQFLPIVFVAFLLVFGRRFSLSLKKILVAITTFIVGFVILLSPFLLRNYIQFGTFSLSTKGPFTVYFYDVAMLMQYRDNVTAIEATDRLFALAKHDFPELQTIDDLKGLQYASYLNQRSIELIAESPFLYTKLHISSLATFFFSDGYRLILKYINMIDPQMPNITFLVLQGEFQMLTSYLRDNPLSAVTFIGGMLLWAATSILTFAALPLAYFRERHSEVRAFVYAFVALTMYFAVLTGLAAMARYRVPVTPFMLPLAVYSLFMLRSVLRKSPSVDNSAPGHAVGDSRGPFKYRYYYDDLKRLLAFVIPSDAKVLIVRHATPETLVNMGRHEYVVMPDTIGSMHDIGVAFDTVRSSISVDGRFVITFHNYLWEPIFAIAEKLHLKAESRTQNWLTPADVRNLLYLSGFEVVRSGRRMLFPVYIPVISTVLNAVGQLPLINRLCITNYIIARPIVTQRTDFSVSVIVPARNERGNIAKIVERIPKFGTSLELIFIEGHSKDDTWGEIQRVARAHVGSMRITSARQDGIGKGDAVRKGFAMAAGDLLMILDADMTVAPEDLPKFYEAIAQGKADFINGSRLVYPMEKEAMRFLNTLGNKFFAILFTWLLDQNIKDTLCGTKVLRKERYEAIARNRVYFGDFDPFGDYDLLFGAVKQNLKIIDLPIRYRDRTYGTTQIHRFAHGWLLLKMCAFAARKIKFH